MSEIETITLLGAGGKMGCRIADNLEGSRYDIKYVEVSDIGKENLRQRGLEVTPASAALPVSDAVILAVPDNRIAQISAEIVPQMKSGATIICLDPAAPCAGAPGAARGHQLLRLASLSPAAVRR